MAKKNKKIKKKKRIKKIVRKNKKIRKPLRKRKRAAKKTVKKKKKFKRKKPEIIQAVHQPKIKVIGIGGGGGSIINEIAPQMKKIDFVAANTDIQALKKLNPKTKQFSFGKNLTGGLGSGMNPKVGELAAQSERDRIKRLMEGQDLCIFVSCLGGGTGSGAAPLFGEIAKEMEILTFGIFTLPFRFEGSKKMKTAKKALRVLESDLNAVCLIPNQKIFQLIDQKTPLRKALSALNKILAEDLKGLIEFIYWPGLINIDFADLKSILEGRGKRAYLNSACSQGKDRAEDVVEKILNSPLYRYGISGTDRIIFNIGGGKDLKMSEVEQISKKIYEFNPRAKIIFGVAQYPKYNNKIKITLLTVTPAKKEKKEKKKIVFKTELKKDLIEEKLDLPLARIKSLPKKIRKIRKIKRKKKTSGAKKAGLKNRTTKKIKKKAIIKKIKPKRKIKTKKTVSKSVKKSTHQKVEIKTIKKEETLKPKEFLPTPASYSEFLNSQKETEKIRKNALDIRREAEEVEKEIEKKEKRWDIPAFLRRRKIGPET